MSVQKANKNEVRKEIADLINRIKEQSDRIGMQREIPQSELDLILHRIEELHRKTVVWSYLNELPEEVSGSQFPVSGSQHTVEDTKTSVTTPPPVQNTEERSENTREQETGNQKPPVVDEVKPPVIPPPPVQNTEQRTESNGKQETGNPVQNKAEGRKQLKDVKSFIGFNEKLMYIRQVFKGDSAAYESAITQFNSMESWDEAQAFLSVLAGEYSWNRHDEPVEIFTQTVKRRFS